MNLVSRAITGGALIIAGLILIVISLFTVFTILIYGIPLLVVGLIIFLNKKEDEIEERKDLNKTKNKK